MNKREIGSRHEDMAAAYLKDKGLTILEQNYRDRYGEIDLIAREDHVIIFVEVKYRSDAKKGRPEEAVGYAKQKKIRDTARYYLYTHHLSEDTPCRFDVVAILGDDIRWICDAF